MKIRRMLTGVMLTAMASTVLSVISGGPAAHAATPLDVSWVHVKNQHSGKCLDIRDQSSSPGAPLQQVECKDIDGQQFHLGRYGDDTYQFVAKNSFLCIEVTYSGIGDWVPLQMNRCTGAANQRFHLVEVTKGPVVYYGIEPSHVTNFCARVDPRGVDTDTALIMQFGCDGNSSEHWSFF